MFKYKLLNYEECAQFRQHSSEMIYLLQLIPLRYCMREELLHGYAFRCVTLFEQVITQCMFL